MYLTQKEYNIRQDTETSRSFLASKMKICHDWYELKFNKLFRPVSLSIFYNDRHVIMYTLDYHDSLSKVNYFFSIYFNKSNLCIV